MPRFVREGTHETSPPAIWSCGRRLTSFPRGTGRVSIVRGAWGCARRVPTQPLPAASHFEWLALPELHLVLHKSAVGGIAFRTLR